MICYEYFCEIVSANNSGVYKSMGCIDFKIVYKILCFTLDKIIFFDINMQTFDIQHMAGEII